MNLELVFLDPKTTSDSQIGEVTHLLSKTFREFNTSVGAPIEVVEEEFGNPEITPMIVGGMCKSYDGYAAVAHDNDGEGKIVGVSFVDVHAKGSKVATLGPVSSVAPGAGRKTFMAACAHAEKLGFSTLILTVIAANPRSFALYSKVGFQAKHTCQYVGGFLSEETPPSPPLSSSDGDGSSSAVVTLTAMTTSDIEECAALFLAAHGEDCGWDRRADITGSLASGFPFPKLVARDADGKIVGYSTGFYTMGHTVAKSNDVFIAMFREASRLQKQAGLPCPRFYCPVEFTGLLSWVLAQEGMKVFRAIIIMAKGDYEHTPWSDGAEYVVAPSTTGY